MRYTVFLLVFLFLPAYSQSSLNIEPLGYPNYGTSGELLPEPLSVVVRSSRSGEPVAGIPVHFTVSKGGADLLPLQGFHTVEEESAGGLVVETDENGIAGVDLELGHMGEIFVEAGITDGDGERSVASFRVVSIDLAAIIFKIVGGLALFLLGLQMMSSSLQQVAGNRMKSILRTLTTNRFTAVIAGAIVTALIQSSSATTVITVGFVNSALMTLQQAVGVVLGANIGTTITGQLIAFKITAYAFPMIAVGFAFSAFSKDTKRMMWGRVVLGLGLLFLGMTTMSGVLKPIRSSAPVIEFFSTFSRHPILAILAGTLVTVVVQSSSATVGLTMTLAGSGLIGLQGAIFLVLGDNIGTTITAQLAAIGSNRTAKQAAMAHTLINIIGATYFALLVADGDGFFIRFIRSISSDPMRQVANAHTVFNVVNVLLFIPFVPALARLCKLIIPDKDEEELKTDFVLDENLLSTPVLALDSLNREVAAMAELSAKCIRYGAEHFVSGKHREKLILDMEDRVDLMQQEITVYVSKLFKEELTSEQSLMLPVILHTVNDIERVSDHAVNMLEARQRVTGDITKSEGPLAETAGHAFDILLEMTEWAVTALKSSDIRAAQKILVLEGRMNQVEEDARDNYGAFLATFGPGNMEALAILDFIEYCERAADHLKNIAQSIIGGGIWHGQEPGE